MLKILFWPVGVLLHVWSALAIYYCSFPAHPRWSAPAAVGYLLFVVLVVLLRPGRTQALFFTLAGFVAVALWFSTIKLSPDAVYPAHLVMPYADFKGESVTIHNVRNCDYRSTTDFDVRYETRTYNLADVRSVDLYVNYWGIEQVAHTFVSFGFSDGRYLAVSIECRPPAGKTYGILKGLFKQYGLIYVWADERDVVRLRANYRNEDVYLYRTTFTPEDARKLFVAMLEKTNANYRSPAFYNTLFQSCTNTIGNAVIEAKIYRIPFWKRRFLTGTVDRRLYRQGWLDTSLPFAELRKRANIDARAQAADQSPDFSREIRANLTTSLLSNEMRSEHIIKDVSYSIK